MNEEAGRTEPVSTTSDVGVGGREENMKTFYKLDMIGHKDFFESGFITKGDTLSKGVVERDTQTRFRVEFVGRVGTQPGKT